MLGASFAAVANLENKIRSFVESLRGNKKAADEAAKKLAEEAKIRPDTDRSKLTREQREELAHAAALKAASDAKEHDAAQKKIADAKRLLDEEQKQIEALKAEETKK